jgi:hypothetical protein
MTDIRSRLSTVDRLQPPAELWTIARQRAEELPSRPSASHRHHTRRSPVGVPTGWRRLVIVVVAFAVFFAAIWLATGIVDRTVVPAHPSVSPSLPSATVDPFSSLSPGWSRLADPPEVRCCAATAWTGSEFLMWGGQVFYDSPSLASGWIYDPSADRWTAMPESPLGPRQEAASAWTGSELLIWGGTVFNSKTIPDDGAAFDPSTGEWRPLPPAPIDARQPFAVWTGDEMIVWGSQDRADRRVDGAAYDPASDRWRKIADAPAELTDATAVWTGKEMIVFGAALHGGNVAETATAIAIAYNPVQDSWRRLPDSDLDTNANSAVWTGDSLLAWDYDLASQSYDPSSDRWSHVDSVPMDGCEDVPTTVWAGVAYGKLCGQIVMFDAKRGGWRTMAQPPAYPSQIYAAGSTLLMAGFAVPQDQRTGQRLFGFQLSP